MTNAQRLEDLKEQANKRFLRLQQENNRRFRSLEKAVHGLYVVLLGAAGAIIATLLSL